MSEEEDPAPRPERRFLIRSVLAAVLIVVLTAGATATAGLLTIDEILPEIVRSDGSVVFIPPEPTAPGKPQTVLLLGSDKRWADKPGDPVRSDTMMLVRLDAKQRATTVLSIPRDLRTLIPGHGVMKINDAYALGGPKLAVETIRQLTGLKIHHVVNVNFGGFRQAIDLFDCFYVDVDRRYFHSNDGLPPSRHYAEIDIEPGYQKLCGEDSLDYVRFRHADSDLTRAARQQDYLRAAKDQVSTSRLIDDLKKLGEITAKATQTDRELRTKKGFLRIAKLALSVADLPVRQIDFPATFVKEQGANGEIDYVEASTFQIAEVVDRFLHGGGEEAEPRVPAGSSRSARATSRRGSVRAARLVEAREAAAKLVRDQGRKARAKRMGFLVRFPSHITPQGSYDGPLRLYALKDRAGRTHRAYRFTLVQNRVDGQFYGVQGMTWRNPPLLAHPSATRVVKGRRLELFRAGSRLRFVAWRTDRAVYWISNTLNLKLTDAEMIAMAASLTTPRT